MIISSANIVQNDPVRYLDDAGRRKFISSANIGTNDPGRYLIEKIISLDKIDQYCRMT